MIVEEGGASLSRPADSRRFSLRVIHAAHGHVELGFIAVHADYFSRRVMAKTTTAAAAAAGSYANLYALSGTVVNVTRLGAILVELYQLPCGKIDFDGINSSLISVMK